MCGKDWMEMRLLNCSPGPRKLMHRKIPKTYKPRRGTLHKEMDFNRNSITPLPKLQLSQSQQVDPETIQPDTQDTLSLGE